MMKIRLYAIRDKMVGFWKPFVQQNDLVAVREFKNMIKHSNDPFVRQNYQDLELYFIGTMDEETAELVSDPQLLQIGSTVVVNDLDREDGENVDG